MILVDTSVWIDHFRAAEPLLVRALERGVVLGHPWVTGEVALGNLRNRQEVLGLLSYLPQATLATDDEVLHLAETSRLPGGGIGYVDAQLLAAARVTPEASLWTRDKRLAAVAARLGISGDEAANE